MVKGDFDRLLIVAPPSMLRGLRAAMIGSVQAKVVAEVPTNLTKATNTEIVHQLEIKNLLS
jgi:protein required for attachment to host cells